MKHILLPTDFSDNAWSAIVYAVKLYEYEVCTFYLLHANPLTASSLSNLSDVYLKNTIQQCKRQLEEVKDQIESSDANANHSFETVLKLIDLQVAVKAHISENPIDLIIMGTKGASRNKQLFFGSNTTRLVNTIKVCPILIIPDQYDYKPLKQIVFSTDLNRFYTDLEIKTINDFTYDNNATLRVVNIQVNDNLAPLQQYNLSILQKGLQGFKTHYHSVPNYNKKAEIINTFIQDLNIDLLIMVNYKHSIMERFLNEPVIKKIGFNPSIPFLVIPDNQ